MTINKVIRILLASITYMFLLNMLGWGWGTFIFAGISYFSGLLDRQARVSAEIRDTNREILSKLEEQWEKGRPQ